MVNVGIIHALLAHGVVQARRTNNLKSESTNGELLGSFDESFGLDRVKRTEDGPVKWGEKVTGTVSLTFTEKDKPGTQEFERLAYSESRRYNAGASHPWILITPEARNEQLCPKDDKPNCGDFEIGGTNVGGDRIVTTIKEAIGNHSVSMNHEDALELAIRAAWACGQGLSNSWYMGNLARMKGTGSKDQSCSISITSAVLPKVANEEGEDEDALLLSPGIETAPMELLNSHAVETHDPPKIVVIQRQIYQMAECKGLFCQHYKACLRTEVLPLRAQQPFSDVAYLMKQSWVTDAVKAWKQEKVTDKLKTWIGHSPKETNGKLPDNLEECYTDGQQ